MKQCRHRPGSGRLGTGTSPGIHQGRSCSSSIRWLQLPVRSCRQLEGRVGLGAHPWQWELQGGGWVSPAMPCCWRHPPPIPMREECPEGRALSARASTGRKDQTQTCSSRDPSLYCHSPRGGTGSSGQAPRIGGHPCWHGHMASEDPRQATAPSMATLAHSPHCHLPHGLPVGLGMWPAAAASLKQGLCTSPLPRPALPGRRLELRAGTSGEGPGAAAICGPQHIASY